MSNVITHWEGERWKYSNFFRENNQNTAIIVCPGPSFKKIDIEKLKGPGKTTMGMNTSYPYFVPDMWVGMDDPRCYQRDLFVQPFPKFLRGPLYEKNFQDYQVKEMPNVHYVNVNKCKKEAFWKMSGRNVPQFPWHNNTFTIAFSILVHMGFKNIYLAGCDLNNGKSSYFHQDTNLEGVLKERNTKLYSVLYDWLEWFVPSAREKGIRVRSLSPDSIINNLMPFLTVDEMNERVAKTLPKEGKLWNAFDLQEKEKHASVKPSTD